MLVRSHQVAKRKIVYTRQLGDMCEIFASFKISKYYIRGNWIQKWGKIVRELHTFLYLHRRRTAHTWLYFWIYGCAIWTERRRLRCRFDIVFFFYYVLTYQITDQIKKKEQIIEWPDWPIDRSANLISMQIDYNFGWNRLSDRTPESINKCVKPLKYTYIRFYCNWFYYIFCFQLFVFRIHVKSLDFKQNKTRDNKYKFIEQCELYIRSLSIIYICMCRSPIVYGIDSHRFIHR